MEDAAPRAAGPDQQPSSVSSRLKVFLRYHARKMAFGHSFSRALGERFVSRDSARPPQENAAHWDRAMAETSFSTYLGDTISIDWRNAAIAVILKHHVRANPAVLDIGCAAGTLARDLPPFERYLGVDVSPYAIDRAKADPSLALPNVSFQAADMREFHVEAGAWDAIVLGEVLYYQSIATALSEAKRYAGGLRSEGVLVVSMKDDGKSHAIFSALLALFKWKAGVLWQEKPRRPHYRISLSREEPAYLIGVLQP